MAYPTYVKKTSGYTKNGKKIGRPKKHYTPAEIYTAQIQGLYRNYCFHVHNQAYINNSDSGLKWIPSKFHKHLCDTIQDFVERPTNKAYEILIINTPPQVGKLCSNDTPVLTRNGWKNHGDLVIDDEVIGLNGQWVKVTHVFQKNVANREVVFTNGERIKCHENHEWTVYDRTTHDIRVRETKYIETRISYGSQEKKRGHRYNYQLPIKEALQGDFKELGVDPYVLGVWLGDGTNTCGHICACETDIITLDECRKIYPEGSEWVHKDTGVITRSFKGLYKGLQEYGMCYSRERTEKYIPQDYLTASYEQRLELLAGLIDTDGSLDRKHNRLVFTTADEKLKDTFCELVATFGWRTTVCVVEPSLSSSGIRGKKQYWNIGFNPTEQIPCRIPRKQQIEFSKQRKISICEINKIPPVEGNCIEVEGGIYLVGKEMIPTHNSTTLTETLPSWYLMKHPDNSVIQVSYGDDLAERFGKRNLEKIKEFGEIFGIELDPSKRTSRDFAIKDHKGRMISKGIGAGLTGHSGHLIIIDDPIKNRAEADSERTRNSVWSEFNDSILSRTQAGTKIILVMTRWHEDDLAGRILENMPNITTHVNYECECESNDDPLERNTAEENRKIAIENGTFTKEEDILGDPLCPEIGKDENWLKEFKKTQISEQGLRTWSALYQGHPTVQEGNILKKEWWQYYEPNDNIKFDQTVMSVDATFKDGDRNDFVAISVWGKRENRIYLLKMINEHLNLSGTLHKIRLMKAKYPKIGAIYIEDAANGQAIIQTLQNEIMGIIAVPPDKSKEARVNAVSFAIEAGNVYLPQGDPMTFKFIEQCAKFPNDKHDDMVDSMSMAIIKLAYSRKGRMIRKMAEATGWGEHRNSEPKRVDVGGMIRAI